MGLMILSIWFYQSVFSNRNLRDLENLVHGLSKIELYTYSYSVKMYNLSLLQKCECWRWLKKKKKPAEAIFNSQDMAAT